MFDFVKNLTEARAFRRLSLVDGTKTDDIAIKMLNYLMALKVLYYEDKGAAQRYARQLVNQQSYSGFKTSQPDLYNVLVLLFKHDLYQDRLEGDQVSLPELRIKRNFRDIASGKIKEQDYNEMLIMLMRTLKGLQSLHWRIRRRITNYTEMNKKDRAHNIRYLLILMRTNEQIYPDLYVELEKAARKNGMTV